MYHRWYARRTIHIPTKHTKCICTHTKDETWEHFKCYPFYTGVDTLTDWSPTHTITQHARWPPRLTATQHLTAALHQPEVLEAVRPGSYPQLCTNFCARMPTLDRPEPHICGTQPLQIGGTTHPQHINAALAEDKAHLTKLMFYQPAPNAHPRPHPS